MAFSYNKFKQNKNNVIDNGVNPTERIFVITPNLQSNSETVAFSIATNLPANTTLNYVIAGAVDSDFTDNTASGSFTLDSNGNATVGKTLNIVNNYSNSNVEIQFIANTTNGDMIKEAETNVIIRPATTFLGNGGVESFPETGVKVHTFTANTSFTVTRLDERPNVETVQHLLVGGGGAGGTTARLGLDARVGGGGGAGGVVAGNLASANYELTSYAVTIGEGGANGNVYVSNVTTPTSGSNTTISNANISLTAIGGGHGADFYTNGLSFTRQTAPQDGGSGGGGSTAIYNTGGNVVVVGQGSRGGNTNPAAGFGAGAGGGGYSEQADLPFVGANAYIGDGSDGGNGITTNITGSNVSYAGGGGGGSTFFTNGLSVSEIEILPRSSGGTGGGGFGGRGSIFSKTASNYFGSGGEGNVNTGGGGGGGGINSKKVVSGSGSGNNTGGAGGSGIAVLRYYHQYRLFDLPT